MGQRLTAPDGHWVGQRTMCSMGSPDSPTGRSTFRWSIGSAPDWPVPHYNYPRGSGDVALRYHYLTLLSLFPTTLNNFTAEKSNFDTIIKLLG